MRKAFSERSGNAFLFEALSIKSLYRCYLQLPGTALLKAETVEVFETSTVFFVYIPKKEYEVISMSDLEEAQMVLVISKLP
ncbi:hypothetical protein [Cyclobacterium salsum]|uniref:hypothetical protein n=1 Tax=Cyclobacterium salsum TaxID=2666329 RepID=UPI0013914CD1|nr:hypothetical protein [Cyclobacterium salsum]